MYYQRAAITLIAILMAYVLFAQGRQAGNNPDLTAFSYGTAGTVALQLQGDVAYPGIYYVSDKKMTMSAIVLSDPFCAPLPEDVLDLLSAPIQSGSSLQITCKPTENRLVTKHVVMPTSQLLTLGLLLDLNRATAADLELLPGIGPALAGRIIEYRQKYGDFSSLDELAQVEGIGEKKAKTLSQYLKTPILQ